MPSCHIAVDAKNEGDVPARDFGQVRMLMRQNLKAAVGIGQFIPLFTTVRDLMKRDFSIEAC